MPFPSLIRKPMNPRLLNMSKFQGKTSIVKFFAYEHLPEKLQAVSAPLGELALKMDAELPEGAEKSAGLRKLLEAKDCFVRAALN